MRRKDDAGLSRQQSVWREHDANLAKAWTAQEHVDDQVLVLDDLPEDCEGFDVSHLRVITLD